VQLIIIIACLILKQMRC